MSAAMILSLAFCIPSLLFVVILTSIVHADNKRDEKRRRNSTGGRNYAE